MGFIRLFLAYGVVAAHLTGGLLRQSGIHIVYPTVMGLQAVMFFYVVSGFLISYVLETKYPLDRTGTLRFYWARSLRIYPLWFIMLAFVFYFASLRVWLTGHTPWEIFSAVFLFGSDWTIVLRWGADMGALPGPLGVGWTLGAELTFYVLAPFLFRSRIFFILALAMSLVSRIVVDRVFADNAPMHRLWLTYFFPSTLIYFQLGHIGRLIYARLQTPRAVGWLALILSLATATYQGIFTSQGAGLVQGWLGYASILLFAFSLPTVFADTSRNRISNFFGDLTYPLYLTHETTFILLMGGYGFTSLAIGAPLLAVAKRMPQPAGGVFALLCIYVLCLGTALVALWVESALKFVIGTAVRASMPRRPAADLATDRGVSRPAG